MLIKIEKGMFSMLQGGTFSKTQKSWIALFICLAVFIASILVARGYDTNFGKVTFQEIYFSSLYGESMHGRLHIPANAIKIV